MGPLALLALLVGATAFGLIVDDEGTDPTDDLGDDIDEGVEPETEPDLGASFDYDAETDTVSIDVGDDETGSLAVMTLLDTQDDQDNFIGTYEARYYLVPEGTDLAVTDWETRTDIPGLDTYSGSPFGYTLSEMEEHLGLELLGVVDLGTENAGNTYPNVSEIADDLPDLTANAPADLYYAETATDGDAMTSFLPGDYVVTWNGVPATSVSESTTGSATSDWLVGTSDGITLDGQAGDDRLETENANVTVTGGEGNDRITLGEAGLASGDAGNDFISSVVFDNGLFVESLQPDNVTMTGGEGDDILSISGGKAEGGEGADRLTGWGENETSLHGGAGNDFVNLYGDNMQGFGGEGDDNLGVYSAGGVIYGEAGDDFLGVRNGGTGFGGDGNDHMQVDAGGTADGGAGDDLMEIWDFHRSELGTAVMAGGSGEDTFDVRIRGAFGGPADAPYLRITDFDPDEDVLQIASYDPNHDGIETVEFVEADDGSFTDVVLTFAQFGNQAPAVAVIRLDGVTGLTADDIVVQMAA